MRGYERRFAFNVSDFYTAFTLGGRLRARTLLPGSLLFTIAFVSLRETFEASLLVGIVMTFLATTDALRARRYAWYGVTAGIVTSITFFCALLIMHARLPESLRETYEGLLMIIAGLLVSWLVLSLSFRSISLRQSVEHAVRSSLQASSIIGVFLITFSTVTREGAELAMFLQALIIDTESGHGAVIACLGGIGGGIALAYVMIRWLAHIRVRWLLRISGIILIIIAGEMLVEGMTKLGVL